jgi:hypothetical protein
MDWSVRAQDREGHSAARLMMTMAVTAGVTATAGHDSNERRGFCVLGQDHAHNAWCRVGHLNSPTPPSPRRLTLSLGWSDPPGSKQTSALGAADHHPRSLTLLRYECRLPTHPLEKFNFVRLIINYLRWSSKETAALVASKSVFFSLTRAPVHHSSIGIYKYRTCQPDRFDGLTRRPADHTQFLTKWWRILHENWLALDALWA